MMTDFNSTNNSFNNSSSDFEPQTVAATLAKAPVRVWVQSLAFVGIIGILPFFIHVQWITGPIINATLILILFLSGRSSALVASVVPSIMALAGGLLPFALAPLIPFIIISNIIFVLGIDYLYDRAKKVNSYGRAMVFGAVAKFFFLFFSSQVIMFILNKSALIKVITTLFGITQLYSALLGGLIALVALKWLKRI